MTTFKFVNGMILTIPSLKVQQYLVDIYLKSIGKQVQWDKFEAPFTTRPIDISCSKDFPSEYNEDVLHNIIMRRSHHMEQPIEHCQRGHGISIQQHI